MSDTDMTEPNLVALQEEYVADVLVLDGDVAGRLAAMQSLTHSTAIYHDNLIGMGFIPKLYDEATLRHFESIVNRTYTIIEKLIALYRQDSDYRAIYGFSPLLERLILLDSGYDCIVPITRMDLFLDERSGDFWFCEFNTDGTSAMNEERSVCQALELSRSFKRFSARHSVRAQELFDPWIEKFVEIYRQFAANAGFVGERAVDPVIAIADYTQSATINEFEEFRARFERAGYRCLICDIGSLRYDNGELYANDLNPSHPAALVPMRVDAIYRRAVTSEIILDLKAAGSDAVDELITHLDSVLAGQSGTLPSATGAFALAHAYAAQSVCMVGGFMTQVAHSKQFAVAVHHKLSKAALNAEEQAFVRQHFPFTTALSKTSVELEIIREDKDSWIIKPEDGYGSVGVFAGVDLSQEEWNRIIDEHLDDHYVVQTYCRQYKTLNDRPIPTDAVNNPLLVNEDEVKGAIADGSFDPLALKEYNNLTGLFVYGGKLAGVYMRAGMEGIIVGFHGGVALGSFIVDAKQATPSGIRLR